MLKQPFILDRHQLAVLDQADAFKSAGNDDRSLAGHDALRGERNRLQARTAKAVDRHARNGDRQTGAQRRLAGDIAAGRPLRKAAAEDNILNLGRIDFAAFDGVLNDMAAEFGAIGHVESAAKGPANRRARGGNDDGVGHITTSRAAAD